MRVFIVGQGFDPAKSHFVTGLSHSGIDLEVVGDLDSYYTQQLIQAGVNVLPLKLRSRFNIKAIRTVCKRLKQGGFDIVHSLGNRLLQISLFVSYGLNIKVIAYRGAIGDVHRLSPGSRFKWFNRRVTKIVCVSDAVRDYLISVGLPAEKLARIYKGHDVSWYAQRKPFDLTEFGIPRDAFVVGCIANMHGSKGVMCWCAPRIIYPRTVPFTIY